MDTQRVVFPYSYKANKEELTATEMNLKEITLTAKRQSQKDSCCMLLNYETLVKYHNNQAGDQSSGSQASGMRGGGGCGSERHQGVCGDGQRASWSRCWFGAPYMASHRDTRARAHTHRTRI